MRRSLLICLLPFATWAPPHASAQKTGGPEILVLGTYHMASPGRDVHNMEAGDVLSPTRQREIEELIDVLKRFRPTRIAVEAPVGRRQLAERYQAYLADEYVLSRNEIDQIGFRLARELGHPVVYGVDEDGEFPFYGVQNYAIANGLKAGFDSVQAAAAARVERQGEFLRSHTVLETLEYMNSDSMVAEDVAGYYMFVPFGEPYEYAGPDLIARWFERNIRIYRNIHALIRSPEESILVIYGAGHLGWLQRNIADDSSVHLRKLSDLIEE